MLINPQFLRNNYETCSKYTHEYANLPEHQQDWVKIVDFLSIAYLWASLNLKIHNFYPIIMKLD